MTRLPDAIYTWCQAILYFYLEKSTKICYIYDNHGVVTKYVYGLGLIGEESGGAFKTYHFDNRGSTVAITDASSKVTDAFRYDTYGRMTEHVGNSEVIFGYNGRDGVVTDKNGLIYMRARYYSPKLRRFVNADVIAGDISNAITLNRYAYANGNPVSNIDPFGLSAERGGFIDSLKRVKNSIVNTTKYIAEQFDNKVIQPFVETARKVGEAIGGAVDTVVTVVQDTVGVTVSVGKEYVGDKQYYFVYTLENGAGYDKSFDNDKPINIFVSADEDWWKFWEWSVGIDVNIDGYGAEIELGPDTSFTVHCGDGVSWEFGVNDGGRLYGKHTYQVNDAYYYDKFTVNVPETAAAVAAVAGTVYVVVQTGGAALAPIIELIYGVGEALA